MLMMAKPPVFPPPGEHQVGKYSPLSALLPRSAAGVLQGAQQAAEQLVPEEDQASGDCSLQQAG